MGSGLEQVALQDLSNRSVTNFTVNCGGEGMPPLWRLSDLPLHPHASTQQRHSPKFYAGFCKACKAMSPKFKQVRGRGVVGVGAALGIAGQVRFDFGSGLAPLLAWSPRRRCEGWGRDRDSCLSGCRISA